MLGIDVSEHNGEIDWKRIAAEGAGFAIIRAGYGSAYLDSRFYENVNGAHDAGLKLGCTTSDMPAMGESWKWKGFPSLHPWGLRPYAGPSPHGSLLGCGRGLLQEQGSFQGPA